MLKPAFSTVACPEWTLRDVAHKAVDLGFEFVELRTFGDGSRRFGCDPALTGESKVLTEFREAGVDVVCLATGLRFDEVVWPPVVGYLLPGYESDVRQGKRAVDLALGIECPCVRVFGFEYADRESKVAALKRIAGRLALVVDHADKSGVRIAVENGGSFATAKALRELVDAVGHPLLGASYSLAAGVAAGDKPTGALDLLSEKLFVARIKDLDATGRPVALGKGKLQIEPFVKALVARSFDGPLVFEWDRAWMPELATPEGVLAEASRTIFGWIAGSSAARPRGGASRPVAR